jgi:glycerophosphoryl diester phosphodiesterase
MLEPRWGRRVVPLVIGHRGAPTHETENTLAAFRRARDDGADGVELDVRLARTGEVVVFHDEDLTRLAGRPERIADLEASVLRGVRLAGGHGIPLLADVLDELGPSMLVNVELKAERARDAWRLARATTRVLRATGAAGRVLVSSFHPAALAAFRTLSPGIATGLLFARDQCLVLRRAWSRPLLRPLALHPDVELATPRRIRRWHRLGHAVNVWTVDAPAAIARLAALGVDGIITNDPALARRVL